ncbi:MAG: hypothetical protein K2N81_03745 [Acetatifactor sp.]|nr:hypothetical protein [Acetatifactor sp.]
MRNLADVRKRVYIYLVLCFFLLAAGCAPQEKTLLLETSAVNETGEIVESAENFTVKKIYTYTYDTNGELDKSASLKDCKEHEIRVIAEGGQGNGGMPEGRLVDYRYGFYELIGNGREDRERQNGSGEEEFWSLWPREDSQEDAKEQPESLAYYLEQLELSPDGRQMLVYAGMVYSENRCVWLYDFETQEPWLLYQGTSDDWRYPQGAFSPDGRWVTFDVTGSKSGEHVVVYDCRKERNVDDTDAEWVKLDGMSRIYPPDQTLLLAQNKYTKVWTAKLFDISGNPGVLSIMEENAFSPTVFQCYNLGDSDGTGYNMSQYYLRGDFSNTMPNLRYELDVEENCVYYLEDFRRLWSIDITQGNSAELGEFSGSVLDFLRLDSGEILVLTTQELSEAYATKADYSMNTLEETQLFWDIRSVDLYLYSEDGTGEQLLYKNLQNVINMEYDAETRRILLETYENWNRMSRKCIVLEL